MYDKIAIRAEVDEADVPAIVLRNYLEECAEGDEVFYKSTAYANLDGVTVELRGTRLRCKCSVCKLWARERTGRLDNSRPMTWAMAARTVRSLLMRLYVDPARAVVTYYEVGVTMKMQLPADAYIRQVDQAAGRILWNDPNDPEDRQKVTERSKYRRKVMKMYDKTFEAASKGRHVEGNVLRVETVYRHQAVPLTDFVSPMFMSQAGRAFYRDWTALRFLRDLKPAPGVKMSQLEKAREVQRMGVTRYKQRYKAEWKAGRITRKMWETMRRFADRWEEEHRARYTEVEGELEAEFRQKLLAAYQTGMFLPKTGKV